MDFPPFPGLRTEAFDFLRDLAQNNNREWFKSRKSLFDDEVVWPLRCLLNDAALEASGRGLPFRADPKRGLFRIYRDIRFSKNKDPYKTHAGAVISRSGDHKSNGVVYIHVQPEQSFLAAGFWHPETKLLRAWRARMAADPGTFAGIAEALMRHGLPLEKTDTLKRMPRGFENYSDDEIAPMLKLKSFVVIRKVSDSALCSPNFTGAVLEMAELSLPLLTFGWELERTISVHP